MAWPEDVPQGPHANIEKAAWPANNRGNTANPILKEHVRLFGKGANVTAGADTKAVLDNPKSSPDELAMSLRPRATTGYKQDINLPANHPVKK